MSSCQRTIIIISLIISVVALIIPLAKFIINYFINKNIQSNRSAINTILKISISLIISVWCLRFAVGYYNIITAAGGKETLTVLEELLNSFIHALQTLSMDEDYTTYILDGKKMIAAIFTENSILKDIYGIYASILNIAAPIAGGAIIFEILTSLFPIIKLNISYLAFWKEKYYFSELNNASLALARSIRKSDNKLLTRPILIFTDVYVDGDDEKKNELRLEANHIGGLCIKEDLAHIKKNAVGRRTFFLIDENSVQNLQTLTLLTDSGNSRYLKKAEICLFTNDDSYIQVERSVRNHLKNKLHFSDNEMPILVPVQSYRNMISNLLSEVPLFEPLIGKESKDNGEQELNVTILGTGFIGTEMFLTTYWIGQMLNCKLNINVISMESENEFWSKINYVNPEIHRTTIENDEILQYNSHGDKSDIYCKVNYIPCDLKSSKFIDFLTNACSEILKTDYYLVSLGSDEINISVAETIKKYVGQHHINTNSGEKTIITYVVYDPGLSKILNEKQYYSYVNDSVDVYIKAVGNLDDVNSITNVYMTDHLNEAHNNYNLRKNRKLRSDIHKTRLKDDYTYWAKLARELHIKYKAYSAGLIETSIFDYPDSYNTYMEKHIQYIENYKRMILGEVELNTEHDETKHRILLHELAWLEHRRWCAFTRVKGFRGTKNYMIYATKGNHKSYKQMDIKLHPCLVECDKKGIRAEMSVKGIIDKSTLFKTEGYNHPDYLDMLSLDLLSNDLNSMDFKYYDYPIYCFKE